MTKALKTVLTEIADLFEARPDTWTQGHYARASPTPNGPPIGPQAPGARCWCMLGAIMNHTTDVVTRMQAIDLIEEHIRRPIPLYNDAAARTVEEVVAVLREVVADA